METSTKLSDPPKGGSNNDGEKQQQQQRTLLAPIALNAPIPTISMNGSSTPPMEGRRSPNPRSNRNSTISNRNSIISNNRNSTISNRNSMPHLDPSPMLRSYSTPGGISHDFLEDMEPPPVIPAAIEEGASPRRSRPSSPHSIRWGDEENEDDPREGYTTPRRRGSGTSESTTAWDMSPGGASSIGRNGDAGPVTTAARARKRVGMFFSGLAGDNPSTTSLDDEVVYDGSATPGSRMSANYPRRGDYSGDETETPIAAKKTGFFSKLKHLGHGSHGRTLSGWTVDSMDDGGQTPGGPLTPAVYSPAIGGIPDEDEEYIDMDDYRRSMSQNSAGGGGSRTAPGTPKHPVPRRRATITDITEEARTRDRSSRVSYSRRSSFRRITQFSHNRRSVDGAEGVGGIPPSPGTPGYHNTSKWRALKAGIKMMGQRKKEESKIDREKSAELMAELTAATPAVVILASMFQRDEHGNKRIPILLEQLKVKISDTDKHPSKNTGRTHAVFRIELEYGSGITRMKWVIYREFRDFFNLHSRYRLADISNTTFSGKEAHKLPKFPRATIPYLRGVRGLGSDDEEDDSSASGGETATVTTSPGKKRPKHARRESSSVAGEHLNTGIATGLAAGLGTLTAPIGGAGGMGTVPTAGRKEGFAIKQRQQLEEYLRRLIRIMIFRPDSNRLCKFLELSALGVRLAAEDSYHGKEGYLIIRSAKGSDFRRVWNPAAMAKRHSPKWFLVRHSYIVCVDSPEEMNIYDVFLVDSEFEVDAKKFLRKKPKDLAVAPSNPAHPQHHSLTIKNAERQLKLLAKNERQLQQFHDSIANMMQSTIWSETQRFKSFAPVRKGVFAQWLVDGRDYMWNVSRAISMAKDVIYIHDWWLSPELYLRRPAAVSQKWRLDRLLQRKAQEGVKIFVIVYRNIGAAVPIDSAYTKYSLLDLHPNVFVQRSPNQIRQATFFWAHHEKILVVDHMVAFLGGIDLCFGRWDTPQHSLVDDKPTGFEEGSGDGDPESFQLWPGKDYSNPRVQDFYNLDKPYEEMYDRTKVPRMPWHDIHMQVVGQPARDLTRHFVQRWNYLLRQRTPSRPTPVLLPPPDFTDAELQSLGIDGTCEVQILRSASSWSLGTPNTTEASIQAAYIKSIELSDHFVYIENQFFITSTEWGGTVIENKIGDALVERIIRAYRNDQDWRAIIIIPLMPGFQNTVDAQDGTSVRLIMQCQYRSISRGEHSIFGKLRAQGIEPEEFIQFYGLRNWGKIGPEKALVTEQLYIHAKCMVVDDRIAIIGSANINERSMMGNRDSEVAAIVRDTDTIMSTMAGQPYRVGKFPHTLRLRLMREHLGMDVDEIMANEQQMDAEIREMTEADNNEQWLAEEVKAIARARAENDNDSLLSSSAATEPAPDPKPWVTVTSPSPGLTKSNMTLKEEAVLRSEELRSFNHDVDWEQENNPNIKTRKKETTDNRIHGNAAHNKDLEGYGFDKMKERESKETTREKDKREPSTSSRAEVASQHLTSPRNLTSPTPSNPKDSNRTPSRGSSSGGLGNIALPPPPGPERMNSQELGLAQLSQLPPLPVTSDQDIGGPCIINRPTTAGGDGPNIPVLEDLHMPTVTPDMFEDPLNESFYLDVWHHCAVNNTKLYRQVFRCMPDNEVKTWAAYKEYAAYGERFAQSMGMDKSKMRRQQEAQGKTGPPGGSDIPGMPQFGDNLGEKVAKDLGIKLDGNNKNLAMGNLKDWTTPTVANQEELDKVRRDDPPSEKIEFHPPQHVQDEFTGNRPRSTSHASSRLNTAVTTATTSTLGPGSSCSKDSNNKPDPNLLQSNGNGINFSSNTNLNGGVGSTKRRRRGTTRSSRRDFHASEPLLDRDTAERLLNMTQGHLVVWPYEWLAREEEGGNWLYSIDQLAPIEIYD